MRARWGLLFGLSDDAWKAGAPASADAIATHASSAANAVILAHRQMLGVDPSTKVAGAILGGLGLQPGTAFDTRKDALPLARRMLAYSAMTPAFQTR
jgi:hypothetical protein